MNKHQVMNRVGRTDSLVDNTFQKSNLANYSTNAPMGGVDNLANYGRYGESISRK